MANTVNMVSASLTIMGVVVSVSGSFLRLRSFDKMHMLYTKVKSLMTTTILSRCIYLSQQLLAKKLVKVNKNCRKFEMKYFKAIPTTSDLLIIAFCIHNSLLYQTTLLSCLCFLKALPIFKLFLP